MSETWPELARERAERAEAQLSEAEHAYVLCMELKDEARAEAERLREHVTSQEVAIGRLLCVGDENERLRQQVVALENAGMENAALLGEAEDYIARLDRALTQRNIEVERLRDGDPRFLRLLSKIADECMTDEPDVVWIGAAARTAVDQAEGNMHG